MFACKDFKELSREPSGTEKKVTCGIKEREWGGGWGVQKDWSAAYSLCQDVRSECLVRAHEVLYRGPKIFLFFYIIACLKFKK